MKLALLLFPFALAAHPRSATDLLHQAEALVKSEGFDAALKFLDEAKRFDPDNAEVLYLRGYVMFRLRDLEAAGKEFQQVVKQAPPALYSRYYLGRIAALEGRPEEAIDWLKPVADADPPIFDAVAQLGKAYLDTNQLESAKDLTQKAIGASSWDGGLHYRLGRIYQQLGQPDLARQEFTASLDKKVVDRQSVARLLECSEHLAKGERKEALRVRQELLDTQQLDPDALLTLGVMLANAGLTAESVEPFQIASQRDPASFQAQFNTGLALLKLGRSEPAIAPLQKSVQLLPKSRESNSALSLAYVLNNRYQDAVPLLETLRQQQPDETRTASLLGLAYLRTGKPEKAIPVLRNALATNEKDPKLYFLLIESLNATENQASALEVAQEALRRFPASPQANLAAAQQLARIGRYREAGPFFAKTMELAPNQIDALLGLGEVQQKAGEYQASLEAYRRALALDKDNPTAGLGVAKDLVFLQRFAEAKDVLEHLVTSRPEDAPARYELSRVYARLGDQARAAEQARIWQQLRKSLP